MAWDALTAAMTDADSPINQTLMDAIRNRLDFLCDGTNIETDLVNQDSIAAGAVGQGELKSSTASGTIACDAAATVANLSVLYAHHVRFLRTHIGGTASGFRFGKITTTTSTIDGEYISTDGNGSSASPNTYNYSAIYHTACPPHAPFKGCGEWGMFAFVLRLKSPGLELASWFAESPPWSTGHTRFEKDDPEAMEGFQPPLWIDVPKVLQTVAAGELVGAVPGDESEGVELVMIDTRSICLVETTFCPVQERATIALAKAAEITDEKIRDAPEGPRRQYLLDKRGRLLAQAERPAALAAEIAAAEDAHDVALSRSRDLVQHAEMLVADARRMDPKTEAGEEAWGLASEAMRASWAAANDLSAAVSARRLARRNAPQPMKARDALIRRAPLHGLTPWELLKREHPEVAVATAVALEGGQPIRSGVPDFDENMVILRP